MAVATSQPARLASLDQFRGYTVAGMYLVNYLGQYDSTHDLLRHHDTYCSYADTIMPQFFFAVGFSFRLTYLRRREQAGTGSAWTHAIRRNLALLILGLVIYGLARGPSPSWDTLVEWGPSGFISNRLSWSCIQTLVHIAITSLFVLPVIGASVGARVLFIAFSGLAHLLISHFWYYEWNATTRGTIDGGPLGFMTWTIPVLAGSIAYDVMTTRGSRDSIKPIAFWSVAIMVGGYSISCLNVVHNRVLGNPTPGITGWIAAPPFVKPWLPTDFWTMSQHAGSLSYLTFATGFSLLVLVFFIWFTDIRGIQVGFFRTLGVNALAAYVLEDITASPVRALIPESAPLSMALISFLLFFGLSWMFLRHLEKHKLFLRL